VRATLESVEEELNFVKLQNDDLQKRIKAFHILSKEHQNLSKNLETQLEVNEKQSREIFSLQERIRQQSEEMKSSELKNFDKQRYSYLGHNDLLCCISPIVIVDRS
jgi:hypothetical protein